MDEPMQNSHFRVMTFLFKIRDLVVPRKKILGEIGIRTGQSILDYGCGPGSYTITAAKMIGDSGEIYALDIHPLAIARIKKLAAKKGFDNIKPIQSDCDTRLEDRSIDRAFLFDIYHDLSEPDKVLKEIYRVLKPEGTLSMNDHHLDNDEIISGITKGELFKLNNKNKRCLNFQKQLN